MPKELWTRLSKAQTKMPKEVSTRLSKAKTKIPRVKTDLVLSIRQEHMNNIVSRKKNHEFRKYLIRDHVERIWFYVSTPDQHLRYIAVIGKGKVPGEVQDKEGLGNVDFNEGRKESKYGYEIFHLYRLKEPLSSSDIKSNFKLYPPQQSTYLPEKLFNEVSWDEQEKLF